MRIHTCFWLCTVKYMSVFGLVLVSLIGCFSGFGATVTLAWDPSPDSSVVGYNIYYGVASGDYTNMVPVSNTNTVTLDGLVAGVTYYFAATARNTVGLESDYSDEVSYLVPLPAASLAFGNLVQVYDGQPKKPSVATQPSGLAVALTYDGSSIPPTAPGCYQVAGQVVDTNYAGSATVTMTVAARCEALVLDWPATTNAVTLYQSTNLTDWTLVSNASPAMVILKQPGARFFRAACQGAGQQGGFALSLRSP